MTIFVVITQYLWDTYHYTHNTIRHAMTTPNASLFPVSTTDLALVHQSVSKLQSANKLFVLHQDFHNQDPKVKQRDVEGFSNSLKRHIKDACPEHWYTFFDNALQGMRDNSVPWALQYSGAAEPIKNDINGNNHFALKLACLDASGDTVFAITTTFVEVRDTDGWNWEWSQLHNAFSVECQGAVLDDDSPFPGGVDRDALKTACYDFMEELYNGHINLRFCPTPDALAQAKGEIIGHYTEIKDKINGLFDLHPPALSPKSRT